MISYPLREYISSKKDDDYHRPSSSAKKNTYTEKTNSNRLIYFVIFLILLLIFSVCYSYYSYIDPTCFNKECTDFVCHAYAQGLIGGHLCPDLCTARTLQLQNCLGEHKHFRSRLFDDNEGQQVIRCYLRHPLSKSNPSGDVKNHFNFPNDESTLDVLYNGLQQHIQKIIALDNPEILIDALMSFADFNKDGKISLSEARSIWSLVQIDEFIYTILLSDKAYTPKIVGTCGHIFALEKVVNPDLPFDDKKELFSSSERPNWYQRVRLAIGILEYFSDTWHHQDTDQHLYLCQPLIKSFGYDKDYESKMLKLNHIVSSKSIISRLPNQCHTNKDCLYDSYCHASCNMSTNTCQMKGFNRDSLGELCSLISSLVVPEANSTFLTNFNVLIRQCQQIVTDESSFDNDYIDLTSLQIRKTLILQNLKNLLWANIEYQMNKITKKSTKKPAPPPLHAKK
ncbi:unnamed protein product [Adineta steineri]|uniref:EF-hand domain-containing protein n=1 Tax=Adineta steineri TaxID=433720 RepID=A0A815BUL9_9BILA|nr:unnamed protein product [Adineta steineri]CAF1272068.1 unnamed protein product [Adineta steineri]CAF3663642.1 unnamed protein product [Adineta steineri]CAF3717700.1 unnamed protein product [Adineta steineri]CAF3808902.1 unnamed protein product [Adineta steineri]